MNETNEITVLQEQDNSLLDYDYNNVLAIAEKADKMVAALNKIMNAALKITTEKDWTIIGGQPYLQESGATKVSRLFGISWKICDGFPKKELDGEGYPTYSYRMIFRMGTSEIEADGMRNGADEFFTGKGKTKKPDAIDFSDVMRSAYTNCLNRGIKAILPGLKNIDVSVLEAAGLATGKIKGYTFKEGSQGGKTAAQKASDILCAKCGNGISQKVASFSQAKFGKCLCMNCQKGAKPDEDEFADDRAPFPDDSDMPFEG